MALNLFLVIAPLIVYIVLLILETIWVVHKPGRLQLTWEISHTLLIFGINSFVWLFSNALPAVAAATANVLLAVALCFIVRAGVYLVKYYFPSYQATLVSWLFVLCNLGVLVGVGYTALITFYIIS